MKFKDLQNKTREALEKLLFDTRGALQKFRFGGAGAKSKNVKEGLSFKKDIARILTLMNKK